MDYVKIMNDLRQDYTSRMQSSQSGSMEKHVYSQILQFMARDNPNAAPLQQAFEMQISLSSLIDVIDPPAGRPLVQEALDRLTQEANLTPFH